MHGDLEYNASIFDHASMESLAAAFNRVLVSWSTQPSQTISQLALVESTAHIPAVPACNPVDCSFGAFLASAAVGFSHRQAAYDDTTETSYTYRELFSMAKRIQERLRPFRQLQAQGMVLLLLERNVDVVATEIGVSLAGLAWVPCDIFQPLSRIQAIVDDVHPVCIVAHLQVLERLGVSCADFTAPVLFANEVFQGLVLVDPEDIVADNATNAAYMIYTSGSSGIPKAIAIGHFSIIALIREMIGWIDSGLSYNSVATCNVAWDPSLELFYCSLSTGGCLKLPKIDGEKDGEYLSALMKAAPTVNTVGTTAAALRMWFDQIAGKNGTFFPDGMLNVRIGGDEVSPTFVQRVFEHLARSPAARVKQVYGPTEGTVFCSYGDLSRSDLGDLIRLRRTPIDKVMRHSAMTVVNPDGNELPRGFVGEIVIWGQCLLLEYWNRPELNSQRFLVKDRIRGWRSGDFGRHLPSGKFEIFGRMDSMHKVRGGFRVELGEIDVQIRTHDAVKDCYVSCAGPTTDSEAHIVAHVVFHSCKRKSLGSIEVDLQNKGSVGSVSTPTQITSPSKSKVSHEVLANLYRHISNRIPTYMMPDYVVSMDTLPLTSSTKVDKSKLPSVSPADRFQLTNVDASDEWTAEDQARRSTVETILRIFATVLSLDRQLLPQDNFYNCGGHSLIATQATNLIRRELEVPLPFTAIATHPTASELARFADSLREHPNSEQRLPPNIIALQPSGFIRERRAVMVVFPFMCGLGMILPRIANNLDNENLGLATYGLSWEPGRHLNTYDKIASAYAESISALAGTLPCFLLGWCYGGLIATRVSQRLPQATTHGIFIEVPHPSELPAFELRETAVAEDLADALGAKPKSELEKKIVQAVLDTKPDWHDIPTMVGIARVHGDLPHGMTDDDLLHCLNSLADAYDVLRDLHGHRRFDAERREMEACVALHIQAKDRLNCRLPGIPVGLGWEKYEILDDGNHDTVGFSATAHARMLAVVRRVLGV